jgi:predicted ATPase
MPANLIAPQSEGNPFRAPKVCKALHPRGLGRFYASRNVTTLLPYHGTGLN